MGPDSCQGVNRVDAGSPLIPSSGQVVPAFGWHRSLYIEQN
jgi:hypothetical protein